MGKLKAAVIGLTVGEMHIIDYIANPDIEEIVICDINEEKLEKVGNSFNINKRYTDYNKMFQEEKPDIVSVCVSNFLHKQVCIDAFKAGAHVLCEKPLARTAQECEEIKNAAEQYNKKLMINFNRRYNPESVALKKAIDEGKLGEIYYATTCWKRTRGVPWWYPLNDTKEKCGGGAFVDLGVHMLDLCMWLCGYPKPDKLMGKIYQKVSQQEAKKRGFENFDAEDMGVAMIFMENGMTMETEISWASNREEEEECVEVRLYGTKGGALLRGTCSECHTALLIDDQDGVLVSHDIQSSKQTENVRDAFVNAVINQTEVPCSSDEAIIISKIIDGVYLSSKQSKAIDL